MKKYLSFVAAASMACLAIVSCEKNPDGGKDDGDNNPVTTPTEVNISIDGDFGLECHH